DLGRFKRIVVDKDNTTLVDGAGTEDEIQGRIRELKAEIDKSTSDYDKEKLQERLAKLSGGVAIINVGAATESEMKEKKARVEDGVIDPTKVARMALQNAASIAGLLLMTECTIVEHREEKSGASPAGHGGMDGMY